ncbi:MAG: M23 family metallopeptidase, partial [Holophagaceae bacterium]|nr:M23 family metallopeptidase [Holophagaceae bacterium]
TTAQTPNQIGVANRKDAIATNKQANSVETSAITWLEALPLLPSAQTSLFPTLAPPLITDPNDDYFQKIQLTLHPVPSSGIQTSLSDSISPIRADIEPEGLFTADPLDHYELDLLWPVETRTISSAWGPRIRTITVVIKTSAGNRRVRRTYDGTHKGIDLTAPKGHSVFAAMDGRVSVVGRDRKLGFFVKIDHGNGIETLYGHNSKNLVAVGDVVLRGQIIARVGSTGNSTGPHIHFEVRINNQPVNPAPWLNDTEELSGDIIAYNEKFRLSGNRAQ